MYNENDSVGQDVVYAKDKAAVFMDDKKVNNANLATFIVLGENYASDNQHVFYKTNIVLNADPFTFKVFPHDVGNADASDAKYNYHEGIKVVNE